MRKPYKPYPLDQPDPTLPGEKKMFWPTLQVRVGYGHERTPRFDAIVDSGSPWCIFRADVAELVNIKVKNSQYTYPLGGVIAGPTKTMYFHKVKIYVEADWIIEVMAGFVDELAVTGILGRQGFFTNFKVSLDHSTTPPIVEIERFLKV